MIIPVLAIMVCIGLAAGGGDAALSSGATGSSAATTESDGVAAGANGVATESGGAAAAPSEVGKTKPRVQVPTGPAPAKLEVVDLVKGTGPEARAGDEVTVHYVLLLYKGGKEVEDSWSTGKPFSFKLGAGKVTAGWEQGIEGMRVRGRRELIAPPRFAYGNAGSRVGISPNETLVSVIDLLAVK